MKLIDFFSSIPNPFHKKAIDIYLIRMIKHHQVRGIAAASPSYRSHNSKNWDGVEICDTKLKELDIGEGPYGPAYFCRAIQMRATAHDKWVDEEYIRNANYW